VGTGSLQTLTNGSLFSLGPTGGLFLQLFELQSEKAAAGKKSPARRPGNEADLGKEVFVFYWR
jgi:hypothetical protein